MQIDMPKDVPQEALKRMIVALADDELVLGHRDSEWTGYAPILEEDIAFSNIAQDELGHSLAWFLLYEKLGGPSPDQMGFERRWEEFRCCRFVEYPRGDFAYTVIRQFLFDGAEQVRMNSLSGSSFEPFRELSAKILAEEAYHLMHSQSLIERLGDATEESHRRMQTAVDSAFPQALGMFEEFTEESNLVNAGVVKPSGELLKEWMALVVPALRHAGLLVPVVETASGWELKCRPEFGGRKGDHTRHLRDLVSDLQKVYQMAPGQPW